MFKSSSTSSIKQLWLLSISSSGSRTGLKSFKNFQHFNGSPVSTTTTIKRFKATALNISEVKNEDNKTNYVPTLDQRAKFGHTGKQIQEKIALEGHHRAAPLLNLVFANRKLSFYDTSNHAPTLEEAKK